MAEIVELKAYREKRRTHDASAGPAEVVVFPGVRIDRERISLADRLSRPNGGRSTSKVGHRRAKPDD